MKTRKLTLLVVVLLLAGALIAFSMLRPGAISAAAAAAPSGAQGCGAVGAYGYTGFGNTFEGNALGFPAGIASTNGILTIDGRGNWSVREAEIINGVLLADAATFGGPITFNPDCSFTASMQGMSIFVGVVVDRGNQIRAMSTIPGVQVNYISTVRLRTSEDSQ